MKYTLIVIFENMLKQIEAEITTTKELEKICQLEIAKAYCLDILKKLKESA